MTTKYFIIGLAAALLAGVGAKAQTTIFSENFEEGSGVTLSDWTFENGSQTNQWHVGTNAGNGPTAAGSKAAYISNNGGSYSYSGSASNIVHLYRDITLPSPSYSVTVNFDWKGDGTTGAGYESVLRVYFVDASVTPTAGELLSGGYSYAEAHGSWQQRSITYTSDLEGAKRLVFSWYNRTYVFGSPAAIDNITVTCIAPVGPASVNLTAAGTLQNANVAGAQKLTLTGSIDARDVKFMRDNMPYLAELDLSGATVVAYEGTEGTISGNITYPANEMPQYSFLKTSPYTGKTSLTSVKLPTSLTTIGYSAFYGCSGLSGSLSFPTSLTTIGQSAFYNCSNLNSLSFPANLTTIGQSAFYNCSNLNSLDFPENLTTIGQSAFSGCSRLSILNLPANLTSIGSYAFQNCSNLKNFNFPMNLTSIGSSAFYGCSSLSSLNFPAGLTSIGSSAFSGCSSLSSLSFPAGLTSIDVGAFRNCSKLSILNFPENLTSIGNGAFENCSNLSSLNFLEKLTTIGSSAFSGCINLSSLSFPAELTSIGSSAFSGCSGLISLTFPAGLTSIGDYAFQNCSNLSSLSFPAGLTSIGNYAFQNCSGLIYLNFPAGLTSIGTYAFENCSSLSGSLSFPEGLTSIGMWAFGNCSELTSVTLPASLTSFSYAFASGQRSLTSITNLSLTPQNNYLFYAGNTTDKSKITLTVPTSSVALYEESNYWKGYKTITGGGTLLNVKPSYGALGSISGTSNGLRSANALVSVTAIPAPGYSFLSWTSGDVILGTDATLSFTLTQDTFITANFFKAEAHHLAAAGTLKDISGIKTVTHLTLTGNIDARDVKLMRDNMPFLTELDLSGASVVAYSGTEGTAVSGANFYPANEMPQHSFASKSTLTSVKLPAGLASIGESAFSYCRNLTSVTNPSLAPQNIVAGNVFVGVNTGKITLTVPTSSTTLYEAAAVWQDFGSVVGGGMLLSVSPNNGAWGSVSGTPGGLYAAGTAVDVAAASLSEYPFLGWTSGGATLGAGATLSFTLTQDTVVAANFGKIGAYSLAAAGTLKDTAGVKAITHLTLTGIIDASDVRFMRDSMPYLMALDLSGSTVVAYSGAEGTSTAADATYPANEMPQYSFCSNSNSYTGKTSLTLVKLPTSLTAIGSGAFAGCRGLSGNLTLPESLTSIGERAFYNCSRLSGDLNFPEGLTTIGGYAFSGCSGLSGSLSFQAGLTSIGERAFYNCSRLSGGLSFPEGLTSIGSYAFYGCSHLSGSLTFQAGLTSIGDDAFYNCSSLSGSLTFPEGLTSIGNSAFYNCSGLSGSLTFPEGLTTIGNSAFYNCSGLSGSLNFPEGLTTIGNYAFDGCSSLSGSLTFQGSPSIGEYAFRNCSNLSGSLSFPEGLTYIRSYAFQNCSSLSSLTFPVGLTSIGSYAFSGCIGLTSVTNPNLIPQNIATSFDGVTTGNITLTVPSSSATLYGNTTGWKDFSISGWGVVLSVKVNNAASWGSISGALTGLYPVDTTVSIAAAPASGYFVKWMSGGAIIGTSDTLYLTLAQDTAITASFGKRAAYHLDAAGTLKDMSDIGTVTHLTLTGNIDARDVKLMRDNMPYLTELDLSEAIVVAYSGTEGTGYSTSTSYPANEMPQRSFSGKSSLTSVRLPAGLTSIGQSAFENCSRLSSLTLPAGLTTIGDYAFRNCSGLTSVTDLSLTPQSITYNNVFSGVTTGNIPLTVPSSSVSLYGKADIWKNFKNISGGGLLLHVKPNYGALGSVSGTPSGLYPADTAVELTATPAPGYSFLSWTSGSASLGTSLSLAFTLGQDTAITANFLKAGIYDITAAGTLKDAADAKTITHLTLTGTINACDIQFMRDSIPYLIALDLSGATVVAYSGTEGTNPSSYSYSYPANEMPQYSFYNGSAGKTSLTSVKLPVGLTSIGSDAFYRCSGLEELSLPAGLTSIGSDAFYRCSGLEELNFPAGLTSIGSYAFYYCSGLKELNFPAGLTSIGERAFSNCSGLKELTFPAGLTSIGNYAFYYCSGLSGSLTFPAGLTSIGSYAFAGCSGLSSLTFPAGLTSIGSYAFSSCSGLSSLTFPAGLTSIGSSAFTYCRGLTSVTNLNLNPQSISSDVFNNVTIGNIPLTVPTSSVTLYGNAAVWKNFKNPINGGGTLLTVKPNNAAWGSVSGTLNGLYAADTEVELTATPASIYPLLNWTSGGATLGTDATLSFTLGQDMVVTANFGITGAYNLAEAGTLKDASGVKAITHLTLTGSIDARDVRFMRDSLPLLMGLDLSGATIVAYSGTEGTYSSSYPTSYPANEMPQYSFYSTSTYTGKTTLTSVTLSVGLTSIGYQAFYGCSGLSDVTFPAGLTTIGGSAFSYCSGLSSLTLPAGLTTIGSEAFSNCSGLSNLTLPAGLTTIGGQAFYNCSGLSGSLTLPASLTSIGYSAFSNCSGLSNLTLPAGLTSIGSSAFQNCSGLTSVTNLSLTPQNISSNVFSGVTIKNIPLAVPSSSATLYGDADVWSDFKNISDGGALLVVKSNYGALGSVSGTLSGLYAAGTGVELTAAPAQGYSLLSWTSGGATLGTDASLAFTLGQDTVITANFGNVDVYNLAEAGTLKDVSGIKTITHLTLTGSIDARDVRFMRDSIPYLMELDLSAAAVVAYSGEEGTSSGNTTYPANEMPQYSFYNTSAYPYTAKTTLTSVTLPVGLTSIGYYAFQSCSGLSNLILPVGLTTIGYYAFENCSGLTSVTNLSLTPQNINSSVFYGVATENITLTVPTSSTTRYGDADVWRDFKNVSGGGALLVVKSNYGALGSVSGTLSGLYSAGTGVELTAAPAQGYSLLSWTSGGATLGTDASLAFTLGQDTVITANFGNVDVYNLAEAGTLKDVSGIKTITNLTLTGSIDARDVQFMRDSIPYLTELDLSGATVVAYEGEGGTYPWGSYSYPANEMPQYSFYNTSTSPYTAKTTLTSVTLPVELTTIGNSAFQNCSGLTSVTNPNLTPQNIGSNNVFYGVTVGNITLTVPTSSTTLYGNADVWRDFKNVSDGGILLHVKPNNGALGSVSGTHSGLYAAGTDVELTAVPASGYSLLSWTSGGATLGTSTSIAFTLGQDTVITANFGNAGVYNLTVAGTLKDTSGIKAITHLTLTGSIDARDIRFMRDSIPYLIALDLSGATVVAYKGAEGTRPENTTYPANEMPEFSFYWNSAKITLTSVKLPVGLSTIGYFAFQNCSGLTSVTNPNLTPQNIGSDVFSGVTLKNITLTVPTSSTTLYGDADVWKDFKNVSGDGILLHVKPNNGALGSVSGTHSGLYAAGTDVELTAVPASGYSLLSWTSGGATLGTNASLAFTLGQDTVITANFGVITYTVTFVSNDGTPVSPQTVAVNDTVVQVTPPTRTGYTFDGWYSDAKLTSAWNFASGKITTDTTLYAKWEIRKYNVAFESNGGSSVDTLFGIDSLHTILEPPVPILAGYTFDGWYKNSTFTEIWDFAGDAVTANMTLYAKWTAESATTYYTVTFVSNGETVSSQPVAAGGKVTQPADPTRNGYTFGGWYKEATFTTSWNFASDAVTASMTLYAKWTAEGATTYYTVTFVSNGGSEVTSQSVEANGKVTQPAAPVLNGYTFGGWYREATFTNAWNFASDVVTASITLYAKWTAEGVTTYTVTFVSNGETVNSQPVEANGKVTQPAAPVRNGYTFGGWYREAAFTNAWNFASDVVTASITLYAKWTAEGVTTYTVTFVSNGGTVSSQPVEAGGKVTQPAAPVLNGYIFGGWYREATFTNAWNFASDVVTASMTLYAKWTAEGATTYTVTFVSNGETVSSQSVAANGKVTQPAAPVRNGYIFGGWYREATFTNAWNFASDVVTASMTLYAKWTAESATTYYTVTFVSNGGSEVTSQSVAANGKVVQPAAPVRNGYIFGGWYREAAFTNAWNFASDVVTASITLYAKWTAEGVTIYTVTFASNGGSEVSSQMVVAGGKVVQPIPPTRNGYTFGGWYTNSSLAFTWNFNTGTVTQNITLYARWNALPPTSIESHTLGVAKVYPNPTSGMVTIESDGAEVLLYSLQGVLLERVSGNRIDLSGYPAGVYVLRAGSKAARIVKQ